MYKREIIHPRFIMSDWQFVEGSRGKKIFRHRISGSHCQEYTLRLSEQEKNLFEQRANCDSPYIVRVLHFQSISNFNSANVFTHYSARVFLEHIRYQLTEDSEPPQNYLNGLLEDTLEGFKCIFEEFQPVRVTNSMIFINEEKKIKVWLSPNILQNVVKLRGDVSEQTMVSDIFNIFKIFSNSYEDRHPSMNFLQALEYLEYKKRKCLKKVTSLIPPVSHDYAPKPTKEKLWKTGEKFYSKQDMHSPKVNLKQFDIGMKESIIVSNSHIQSQSLILPLNDDEQFPNMSNYEKKSFGTNIDEQDMDPERRHSIVVRIESARTTSNNLAVHQNFVALDKSQFHVELLDPKRSKDAKLQLIENVMQKQPYDLNLQKICRIYNHALRFDPIMYMELQKYQGRVSKISNRVMLNKILELAEKEEKQREGKNQISQFSSNRAIRIKTQDQSTLNLEDEKRREERVRKILEAEKAKRVKAMSTKATANKTSPQPGKAVMEPQPRPTMVQRRQPIKASIIRNEIENLLGPTSAMPTQEKPRQALPTASYIENKKKDKNKFMKGFKEEVQKLLFD